MSASSLQNIFEKNVGAAFRSPTKGQVSPTTAPVTSAPVAARERSPEDGEAKLGRGPSDLLEVTTRPEGGWKLLRDFIHSQNDRTVHFSSEAVELLGNLPVPRFIVLTENAIYRVPVSCIETGVFFECRTPLDSIRQVVALRDPQRQDFRCEMYSADTSGNVQVSFSLSFGLDSSRRKAMLMCLCSIRPALPVLQKRSISSHTSEAAAPENSAKGAKTTPRSTPRGSTNLAFNVSRKLLPSQSPIDDKRRSRSGDAGSPQQRRGSSQPQRTIVDLDEKTFSNAQKLLHDSLIECSADSTGEYDPSRAAQKPPEKDASREQERQEIKAMLESREAKIVRNIEFKMRYPQRPANSRASRRGI